MFICPDLGHPCLEDSGDHKCIAFKRGISTIIPDKENLQKLCGEDSSLNIDLYTYPIILSIDVGVCTKYSKLVSDSKLIGLMETLNLQNPDNLEENE